ncbi:unnamed protein product [Polarella glacialis]|uniref:RanBD1 domain-containing protein n=1 Tax=Polarella glacialis TaxID=89957 RepID=A0A813LTS6_POLGL|nr:unnamed protein product [Polarella glacialis]CAE8743251.1 unnamed protein product [Polarella glacialis]
MEEEIYSQRSKLYRFSDGDWKERGLGDAKLLRHYETGKTRFLLRQEKSWPRRACACCCCCCCYCCYCSCCCCCCCCCYCSSEH